MKIIGLLALLCLNMVGYSQQSHIENIELKYTLKTKGVTDKIVFISVIPNDIPHVQEVISIDYSHEPTKSYEENENKYVEITFKNVIEEMLVINIQIRIFENDLKTALNSPVQVYEIGDDYLHEEKYIDSTDSTIVETARRLMETKPIKTVENIYDFVRQNMRFTSNTPDNGALVALNEGKGDCQEFTDLFVALCRASKIPSRVTEGLVSDYISTPAHAWAEAYLEKYGWVRFDPTPGNAFSFSELPNKYIKFSSIRRDKRLFNGHRWGWINWGDNVRINEKISFNKQKN